jgi:hypothetical protein
VGYLSHIVQYKAYKSNSYYSWAKFCLPTGQEGSTELVLIVYLTSTTVIIRNSWYCWWKGIKYDENFYYPASSIIVNYTASDDVSTWCSSIDNNVHTQSCKCYHSIIWCLYTSDCTWDNFLLHCFISLITHLCQKPLVNLTVLFGSRINK